MAADPQHRCSNEAERADIYDDFKLKQPLVSMVYIKIAQHFRVIENKYEKQLIV